MNRPKTIRRAAAAALLLLFAAAAEAAEGLGAPRAAVDPEVVAPGTPFAVMVAGPKVDEAVRAVLVGPNGKAAAAAPFFSLGEAPDGSRVRAALLAVPTTAGPGASWVRALSADGTILVEAAVSILPRDFRKEAIPLNPANSAIRTAPDPKKTAEAEELWRILSRSDTASFWALDAFAVPVESSNRTSAFGDRRVYKYANGTEESSIHAGVDFGVAAGTPVRASARGKVMLARDRIVTGKSVVVEHLPGVYSAYYHLSRIDAAEGAVVETGSLLGLSGSTGMSTGPHLHWELRVSGEAADPDAFTSRRILDKDHLISKIAGSLASK